jgi:hypothetical protein
MSTTSLELASRLAAYGAIGVASFAILLSYQLHRAALSTTPPPGWLRSLQIYMGVSLLLVTAGVVIEVDRNHTGADKPPGELISTAAAAAFRDGTASGGVEAYEAQPGKRYGCEQVEVFVEGGRVEAVAAYEDDRATTYWFQGRLSGRGDLSMTYWKPAESDVKNATGVALLRLVQVHRATHLVGTWSGVTRNGQHHSGPVLWARACEFADPPTRDLLNRIQAELAAIR